MRCVGQTGHNSATTSTQRHGGTVLLAVPTGRNSVVGSTGRTGTPGRQFGRQTIQALPHGHTFATSSETYAFTAIYRRPTRTRRSGLHHQRHVVAGEHSALLRPI